MENSGSSYQLLPLAPHLGDDDDRLLLYAARHIVQDLDPQLQPPHGGPIESDVFPHTDL